MKRYTANQTVREGIYFNPRHLAFRSMEEPGPLPGREGDTYLRVPALLLLLVGLPLSVAYVIFLPVIGFVMLFGAIHDKVRRGREPVTRSAETPDYRESLELDPGIDNARRMLAQIEATAERARS